jgi:hypothetical protein
MGPVSGAYNVLTTSCNLAGADGERAATERGNKRCGCGRRWAGGEVVVKCEKREDLEREEVDE